MSKKSNDFIKKIRELNINDNIKSAFEEVDRSIFFDSFFKDKINSFEPIPVGFGEYSDDVTLLADMLNILQPQKSWSVIEIGTGSGYSTAILSTLVKKVVTVEYHEQLAMDAKKRLIDNGYFNIKFLAGDCSELDDSVGFFDAAIVYAGCTHSPYSVLNLLKPNGIAIFPMGPVTMQQITLYKNIPGDNISPFARYKFYRTCTAPFIKGKYGPSNPGIDIIIEKDTK